MGCGDCGEIVVPQLGLLEFVGELWRVVASCGGLWVSCGKHESTGTSLYASLSSLYARLCLFSALVSMLVSV